MDIIDPDGRKWVDKQGNVIWDSQGPTSYATEQDRILGKTLSSVKTGKRQMEKLINSPYDISVEINDYSLTSAFGVTRYKTTTYLKEGKITKRIIKNNKMDITIYSRSAQRRRLIESTLLSTVEFMAVNFGHELPKLNPIRTFASGLNKKDKL